jgi:hypothetical protein
VAGGDSVSARVVDPAGNRKPVKNLGWLLRNWKSVASFHVGPGTGGRDCFLTATLDGRWKGYRYVTDFASARVLVGFLDRPVFRGTPVNWFGLTRQCGRELRKEIEASYEREPLTDQTGCDV